MITKSKNATKPQRRYIVEWESRDKIVCARVFPNLPRARGYVKDIREYVHRDVGAGDVADAILNKIRIYSATLDPVESEVEA